MLIVTGFTPQYAELARTLSVSKGMTSVVKQWLDRPDCRIKPHFLPAYAPHLNAIERLWGVMHREVTHNKFYQNFEQFTEAIDNFFTERLPKEWPIWRDTVSDNFRIISHQDFRFLE